MTRRRISILLAVSGLVIVLGAVIAYRQMGPSDPIPQNITRSVSFPLLYPTKLPANYILDTRSFSASSGSVVTYRATNKSGNQLIFSVQPRPETFDFNAFYAQGLTGTTKFSTDDGEGATGTARGKTIGSFATDKSWVLLTTDGDTTASAMQSILKSLQTTAD